MAHSDPILTSITDLKRLIPSSSSSSSSSPTLPIEGTRCTKILSTYTFLHTHPGQPLPSYRYNPHPHDLASLIAAYHTTHPHRPPLETHPTTPEWGSRREWVKWLDRLAAGWDTTTTSTTPSSTEGQEIPTLGAQRERERNWPHWRPWMRFVATEQAVWWQGEEVWVPRVYVEDGEGRRRRAGREEWEAWWGFVEGREGEGEKEELKIGEAVVRRVF